MFNHVKKLVTKKSFSRPFLQRINFQNVETTQNYSKNLLQLIVVVPRFVVLISTRYAVRTPTVRLSAGRRTTNYSLVPSLAQMT